MCAYIYIYAADVREKEETKVQLNSVGHVHLKDYDKGKDNERMRRSMEHESGRPERKRREMRRQIPSVVRPPSNQQTIMA